MANTPRTKLKPPSSVNLQLERDDHQRDIVNRLRRIEGQARGLIDMLESDRPCEDVALQMSAMRKAMDKAFYKLISCSMVEVVNAAEDNLAAITQVRQQAQLLEKFG